MPYSEYEYFPFEKEHLSRHQDFVQTECLTMVCRVIMGTELGSGSHLAIGCVYTAAIYHQWKWYMRAWAWVQVRVQVSCMGKWLRFFRFQRCIALLPPVVNGLLEMFLMTVY
jgi:hypothetical protein